MVIVRFGSVAPRSCMECLAVVTAVLNSTQAAPYWIPLSKATSPFLRGHGLSGRGRLRYQKSNQAKATVTVTVSDSDRRECQGLPPGADTYLPSCRIRNFGLWPRSCAGRNYDPSRFSWQYRYRRRTTYLSFGCGNGIRALRPAGEIRE